MYEYIVEVTRVIDGDTFEGNIDLGFNVVMHDQIFRLYDIDTPESRPHRPNGVGPKQVAHGLEATALVRELIGPVKSLFDATVTARKFRVCTHKDQSGKYGRWLADVVIAELATFDEGDIGELTLTTELKRQGFEKRENYDEDL